MFKIKKNTILKKINNSIEITNKILNVKINKISKNSSLYTFFVNYQDKEIKVISFYQGFLKKGLIVNIFGEFNKIKLNYGEIEFFAKKIEINLKESYKNLFLFGKEHEKLFNIMNENNFSIEYFEKIKDNIKDFNKKKKLEDFINIFKNQTTIDKLYLFGLDDNLVNQIYFKYKDDSIDIIKANPYILVKYFQQNIKTCDLIAKKIGSFNQYDNRRIIGILYEIFRLAKIDGNSYLTIEEINIKLKDFIDKNFDIKIFFEELDFLTEKGDFVKIDNKYFLREIYNVEYEIAKILKSRIKNIKFKEGIDIESIINNNINKFEKEKGFKLHENQINCIKESISNQLFIITGGPGTGKTTIQGVIFNILKEIYSENDILVIAPTGIASKNISKKINSSAQTIHSALGYNPFNFGNEFKYNEENKLDFKVIIIDEMSMVSSFLFLNLLKATKKNTQIIMVGDPEQLFSIEYGQVLHDIIKSGKIPFYGLNEGFRFKGSVLNNAYKIQKSDFNLIYDKDFIFAEIDGGEEEKKLKEMINKKCLGLKISSKDINNQKYILDKHHLDEYNKMLKRIFYYYLNIENISEIKVLSPFNEGFFGVKENNKFISSILKTTSGDGILKYNKVFKIGDVVVNTLNNKHLGIMNGDNGIIKDIYEEGEGKRKKIVFDIDFSGEIISIKGADIKNIEHSYSLTIHKSQGSGFNTIIIPIFDNNIIFFEKRLLYTAITRSQKRVILVGKKELLKFIINNEKKRNSYLDILLKK